jgi:type IV pilus assembly protein PilP
MMRALVLVPCAAVLLAACDGEQQELSQWMKQVKETTKVSVAKLPEPKKYEPYGYRLRDSLDPFNIEKISVAQAKLQARSSNGIRPDMDRRREPLEAFPLDTLTMVGALVQNKQVFGLVKVDKNLNKVALGNYLGQNFGKITSISETEITLKEIVQDAAGEWTERVSKLQLQEAKK